MENPITDSCRPRCCTHCPGGSLPHHGSSGLSLLLGTDGDNNQLLCRAHGIVNKFAQIQLENNPGPLTTHSASSFTKEDLERFGLEFADLYEKDFEPSLWKELVGVALVKYRERQHSALSFTKEDSERFGLEFADLYEEELEPASWKELAGVALQKYREGQGVELELVGEVRGSLLFDGYVWGFHLYFQAKPNGHLPVQIFAEVFRNREGACHVSFCDIMDPNNPDLLKGCRECVMNVLHPKGMEFFNFPPPEAFVKDDASN